MFFIIFHLPGVTSIFLNFKQPLFHYEDFIILTFTRAKSLAGFTQINQRLFSFADLYLSQPWYGRMQDKSAQAVCLHMYRTFPLSSIMVSTRATTFARGTSFIISCAGAIMCPPPLPSVLIVSDAMHLTSSGDA